MSGNGPSGSELRTRLLARLEEIRVVLGQTAAVDEAHRAEYRRLAAALDALERRVREILS